MKINKKDVEECLETLHDIADNWSMLPDNYPIIAQYIKQLEDEAKESKEDYDRLILLLEKRFPQNPDGSLPDWKIEDVIKENLEFRGMTVKLHDLIDPKPINYHNVNNEIKSEEIIKPLKIQEDMENPDINVCPNCGGPADNGFDRSIPPNPYYCTKCSSHLIDNPKELSVPPWTEMSRFVKDGVIMVVKERTDYRNRHGSLEYVVDAYIDGKLILTEKYGQSKWLGHCWGQVLFPEIAKKAKEKYLK